MRLSRLFLGLTIFAFLTAFGCSKSMDNDEKEVYTTENPNAEEILTLNSEVDIFKFNGLIYKTNINWVEDLSLTKDEKVGEIKERNDHDTNFKNEMSNVLPIGAKIFSAKERGDILIVETEEKTKKYLKMVEG